MIFFTWNESKKDPKALLKTINNHRTNMELEYKIGRTLPFLDLLIDNNDGVLTTSVYRKPAAEPYVAPFASDHSRHIFRNIVRAALRYPSTFEAFNIERHSIRWKLFVQWVSLSM